MVKQNIVFKSNTMMKGHLGLHDALPKGKVFPNVPQKGEIWINKKLDKKRRCEIIKHERFENYLMRKKKMSYGQAHKISQEWEKH